MPPDPLTVMVPLVTSPRPAIAFYNILSYVESVQHNQTYQSCGLSASIGSNEHHDLPFHWCQRDVIDSLHSRFMYPKPRRNESKPPIGRIMFREVREDDRLGAIVIDSLAALRIGVKEATFYQCRKNGVQDCLKEHEDPEDNTRNFPCGPWCSLEKIRRYLPVFKAA